MAANSITMKFMFFLQAPCRNRQSPEWFDDLMYKPCELQGCDRGGLVNGGALHRPASDHCRHQKARHGFPADEIRALADQGLLAAEVRQPESDDRSACADVRGDGEAVLIVPERSFRDDTVLG
jgi:hypothetical protein